MQRTCCFGSPVSQFCFWLMIVSTQTAVLPVLRSPMISWRWPRPIGVIASMALIPVCSGSLTPCRSTTDGGLQLQRSRTSSDSISPRPSIGCAERVDHPAEEAVADRHGEHLAGAGDLLALLDRVGVAQDAPRRCAARPGSAPRRARRRERTAARWPSPRAGPRRSRCRHRSPRRCRPPPASPLARSRRRSSRSRSGSRRGRSSTRSSRSRSVSSVITAAESCLNSA